MTPAEAIPPASVDEKAVPTAPIATQSPDKAKTTLTGMRLVRTDHKSPPGT
jgi:hypothetical protein